MNWRNVEHKDPLLGEVLDERFRIEGLLGQGGMGRVYEGRQLSVDRPVAIKIIRKGIADSGIRDRFMREAQVLSGLSHRNLVRLIDFGIQDGRPYLVMEKVGGIALDELLDHGRLRTDLALEVVKQMFSGLAAAHAAGVVHRDLKPENLHLIASPDGTLLVKILDFGIAFPTDSDERLTKTGQVNGTPRYMAPEQARSGKVDFQADLYSVGIILYEMLAGTPPFEGESTLRIMMKHVREPVPPVVEKIPSNALPSGLRELVDDLLEKEAGARPESARSARKRVREIERRENLDQIEVGKDISIDDAKARWVLGPDEPDPTSMDAARSRSRRHMLVGVGTALGMFAIILISYFAWTRMGPNASAGTDDSNESRESASAELEPNNPSREPAESNAAREETTDGAKADDPQDRSEEESSSSLFQWPPGSGGDWASVREKNRETNEPSADAGSEASPEKSNDTPSPTSERETPETAEQSPEPEENPPASDESSPESEESPSDSLERPSPASSSNDQEDESIDPSGDSLMEMN